MTVDDLEAFFARLAALSELFDARFSDAKSTLYFEALRDLPFDDVVAATNAAAKTCTFMPKPAEIRKLAVGDDEDQAERAWLALRSAMRVAGAYASLATEDPALGETVVAMFGSWPGACESDFSPEMWSSKRKEFSRVYRVLRDRALTGTRYLLGVCEHHNRGLAGSMKHITLAVLTKRGEIEQLRGEPAETYRSFIAAGTAPREMVQLTAGAHSFEGRSA